MTKDRRFHSITGSEISGVAPAKLNLYLEITGKRPDGYHNLLSVFHEIDLVDRIRVTLTPSAAEDRLEVRGRPIDVENDRNLVIRAIRAFREQEPSLPPVAVDLHKEIPLGGGLGGGSADAAFVLSALSALSKWPDDDPRLAVIGRSLGADIPFFFTGGTAICRGIGDEVETVKDVTKHHFLLVRPNFSLSTAEVYGRVRLTTYVPDVMPLLGWLRGNPRGGDVSFTNRLESAAFEIRPELNDLRHWLTQSTKSQWCMTGSGSVLFCALDEQDQGEHIAAEIQARNDLEVFQVASFGGGRRNGPHLGEGVVRADY